MGEVVQIEVDTERDRKTCIALDHRVTGANRELAEWLLNHPHYPERVVAEWLGCGKTRIHDLRDWARRGYEGSLSRRSERARNDRGRGAGQGALETLDNSEGADIDGAAEADEMIAEPEVIEENAIHSLRRMSEHARVFKKFFRLSTFDREAEARINVEIETMIQKWRSAQATLTKRRFPHGKA